MSIQTLSKIPTELQYVDRCFHERSEYSNFMEFELGTQEGINVPIRIVIGFQQRDRQNSQKLNNVTFYRPPVTSAQCIIRTEKYLDSAILLNFDDDDYRQGYRPIKEGFRALTKDDILQPYISDTDFRSSDNNNDIGYNLYVFDMRYQKNLESAQSKK